MKRLNHILAVVDFRQEEHFALPRAIELARLFCCPLTVVANVFVSFTKLIPSNSDINADKIKHDAIEQAKSKLIDLTSKTSIEGVSIDFQITWNSSLHRGLTEYINNNQFDLIVKTTRKHNFLEKILFTPTDWHLLRDTPTNVLFVQAEEWSSKASILGAINIDHDQQHKELNQEIIRTTVEFAEKLQCKSNMINAFPWPAIDLERFNHLFDKKDQFLEIKKRHISAVNKLVDSIAKVSGKVIIGEGLEAEEAIPEIAKSTHSQLLVMGTVGRTGLEGIFVGNTAEKILDQINCEVLCLKH